MNLVTTFTSLNTVNQIILAAIAIGLFFIILEFYLYKRGKNKAEELPTSLPNFDSAPKGRGLKRVGLVFVIVLMIGGIGVLSTRLMQPDPTAQRPQAAYNQPFITPFITPTPTPPFLTPTISLAQSPTPTSFLTPTEVPTPSATPTIASEEATITPSFLEDITATPTAQVSTVSPTKPSALLKSGAPASSLLLFGLGGLIVFFSLIF